MTTLKPTKFMLQVFCDAFQNLFEREPDLFDIEADDDLSSLVEAGDDHSPDVLIDIGHIHVEIRKGRRKIAQAKYRKTEAGQAASKLWNDSKEGKEAKKLWNDSEKGKQARKDWAKTDAGKAYRKAWEKTDAGKNYLNSKERRKDLNLYLNRRIVSVDSEGRCPLHMIDKEGRTPLEAYKQTGIVSPHLKRDSSGHYWEPHEFSLIGAATIDRPFETPIENAVWQEPIWRELKSKSQSEQAFEFLLSLPELFKGPAGVREKPPLFVGFSMTYDWSMWLRDTSFGKGYELARQRGFAPPCRRMRGMVFWKKYAIQIRPYNKFQLSELRWPDDWYGLKHQDDPDYQKPGKREKNKLQVLRRITIIDTFRHAPKPFVEAIRPLMKRGLIPKDVFDTIEREKQKRGFFHLEPMDNVRKYCGYELHSLCVFMHVIRDAYWTSAEVRLKSFHSPAAGASELLKRIGVREHSWPVKSVDLDDEQMIAHWAYYGGRFEWIYKGYSGTPGFQIDLASAYPYAMQFLPSMKGGSWEKLEGKTARDIINHAKKIAQHCILSIYLVKFNFRVDAPFYALPYRLENNVILYPRAGYGYYMRDDLLAAIAWCKKFGVPVQEALIIEEANLFHPAKDAVIQPFSLIAEIYNKRIEFDKTDPGGPEQAALKNEINSVYGKTAERKFRGNDADGKPIIPPHACP